jgi:hypothetical protein
MGHEVIIYGKIEGLFRIGEVHRMLQERNEAVLAELPEEDEWPRLVRGMFALPAPWPDGTYLSQCIHFGASFKDDPLDRSCWDGWIGKFETLSSRLFWIAATVHLETEFESHRIFTWLPTSASINLMTAEDPQPVHEWERKVHVVKIWD